MSRVSALLSRIAAACAVLLVAALLAPAGSASAAPVAGEMSYACALKSNGLLRAVTSLSECKGNETKVTVKPGPDIFCIQPSGSTRLATKPKDCKPPATALMLPPASGTVYFCAALPSGTLRYVTGPGQCLTGEVQVQVTPNDAAPRVTSTSPADGSTHVATNVSPTVTFSEPVTATVGSFSFACDGTPVPFSLSGSPGSTLTLNPTGSLPQGAACTVTTYAAGISDVDTLDPPDNPVANSTFSFTTDAAPSLVSSAPVGGATGVATSTNIVLTFSEPVDVASGAFTLSCGGPDLPFAVTGSHTATVTVNPDADLPQTATCSLTAPAASITDVDAGDPPDALTVPIDITFTTLDAAPSVTSTTPGDGAANVATTADVKVTFSEPVTLAADAFTLVCGGNAVTTTPSTSDNTTFTFAPTSDLTAGDSCTGTVDKTKVTDKDTVDPPDNPVADYSFGFTVDSPPAVASTDPADNAKNVPAGKVLTVTFTEPVTVTKASFVLTCNGNPVDYALGGTDTAVTLTPSSDLPGTATCTLKVVATEVHDVDSGDPPDTMTADKTVTFTTVDTAPSVVSTSPADGATDVSSGAKITVTFSEPVTADSGAFSLACPTPTTQTFTLSGSGTAVWTLTPDANLPVATVCTLKITGSKIHDVDTVDPPDEMVSDVTAQFTTATNSAPTDLSLSASTVAENQPSGTAVGTFSTTDPDPGDTFTYALATGIGDTDNGSFTIVGNELRTAASFDFETKSSYSIHVRTTDSAGGFFEKTFTITVTDVNEAPTDIALSNSSVPENKPSGTVVGTLSTTDPDAGDTFTYSLVAGTGSADNASFTISGSSLQTAGPFDFETKAAYSVRVRSTDSGGLTFEKAFTITVTNVNEAPVVVGDSYSGAIGNTLAVRGVTATGPSTTLTGALPLANDSDPEGDPISVVPGTVTTTGGGTATINADGTFSYLPGVGDVSQTDTFTYTVTDGQLTSTGTISIAIGADRVWWINAAAPAGGDGRSTAPFASLAPVNGAGGSGDADGPGDYLFVYAAAGSYAGGLALEANQRLYGEKYGLTIGGTTLVPAGATAPTITNAGGNGVTLAGGVDVQGVAIANASADGIHGDNITTATIGENVTVSGSGQDGVDLTGAATGSVGVGATITGSTARSVNVSNRSGGTTTFSGPITGPEIVLSGNTGATVAFTKALAISSGADSAFSATGGGTVTASDTTSTLTSTTGSTVVVENTTIGGTGLKFKSVSANGAANGIRLNNTGSSGGLTVVGGGNTSLGGNASGGTIQNTTGAGVSLTSTSAVSLNNLTVSGTPNSSGVLGTQVNGFSFTNGTVTNSGLTSKGAADSNIAFTSGAASANVTGAVSVSNSSLTNAYQHGVHIQNQSGTISSLHLDNNAITSTSSTATSAGNGIFLQVNGSAGAAASVASGTVSGNAVTGFPSGGGIIALVGNESPAAVPSATFGTGAGASAVAISGNRVAGASTALPMGTRCIQVFLTGRATGFADVTNNGTVGSPLGLNKGNCIDVAVDGAAQLTSQITGNVVKPQTQLSGTYGVTGGSDKHDYGVAGSLDSAVLKANVSNNTVSSTTGVGIYFIANSTGTSNLKVQNNSVAAPTDLVARPGIRVDSGTSSGTAVNTTVCLTISGNTVAGATDGTNTYPGIGLRKQGSVATTNTFGITGLAPSPATGAQMEAYVAGQNPASASGTFGTGGAANISATGFNFVSCTMPAF
ncbi:cadherin domain-containing protein [Humibacillus xanthopallidus]|uniref:Cadherin domain-containing protein n=1 Tax=Humibacillus xanthopallidus TaxID=412689 RepID=A0A543PNR5_9MICO|nr:Ig-like domain-containing protein [Humibacillus xanthopallidus]TQN45702.1 cadherin domain-containing protein [Humibacillus xanthopallidus]